MKRQTLMSYEDRRETERRRLQLAMLGLHIFGRQLGKTATAIKNSAARDALHTV